MHHDNKSLFTLYFYISKFHINQYNLHKEWKMSGKKNWWIDKDKIFNFEKIILKLFINKPYNEGLGDAQAWFIHFWWNVNQTLAEIRLSICFWPFAFFPDFCLPLIILVTLRHWPKGVCALKSPDWVGMAILTTCSNTQLNTTCLAAL